MIRHATRAAGLSKFRRARVGAVVAKGERILSTGCNRIGYSRVLPNRPFPESIHAEQAAIIKLLQEKRLNDLVNSTIYVSRIGRDGLPRLAAPCEVCRSLIDAVGISEVVYTTDNGTASYQL